MESKATYEIALTHLKNKQFISAHNLFLNQAESLQKSDQLKSALFFLLAAECKSRQGKDTSNDITEASNLFLKYSSSKDSKNIKGALLCASKCFLSLGEFNKAKDAFQKAKSINSSENLSTIFLRYVGFF